MGQGLSLEQREDAEQQLNYLATMLKVNQSSAQKLFYEHNAKKENVDPKRAREFSSSIDALFSYLYYEQEVANIKIRIAQLAVINNDTPKYVGKKIRLARKALKTAQSAWESCETSIRLFNVYVADHTETHSDDGSSE